MQLASQGHRAHGGSKGTRNTNAIKCYSLTAISLKACKEALRGCTIFLNRVGESMEAEWM